VFGLNKYQEPVENLPEKRKKHTWEGFSASLKLLTKLCVL
jgi:hypothetical protein